MRNDPSARGGMFSQVPDIEAMVEDSGLRSMVHKAAEEAVREIRDQKETALRAAILGGLDGVDFIQEENPLAPIGPENPFTIDGGLAKGWDDEPPEYGPDVTLVERYDFRDEDRDELRELAINHE
mgnify:CR=1 FL=1